MPAKLGGPPLAIKKKGLSVEETELFSTSIEEALIGAILIGYEDTLAKIAPHKIQPDDFFIHRLGWIFEAALSLYDTNQPIDLLSLSNELEKRGRLTELGGAVYLSQLLANPDNDWTHATYYAGRIKGMARLRQVKGVGIKLIEFALRHQNDDATDWVSQLTEVTAPLKRLAPDLMPINGSSWADMDEMIAPIEWAWQGWLPKGLLTMIVSDSGVGKSILAMRIAASFLRGDPWPDGTPFNFSPGAVLWCEAEAAQAVNLDRAKKWGLPIDRIFAPFTDPLQDVQLDDRSHQQIIRAMAMRDDVKLVVIDSLSGGTRRDAKSSSDMLIVLKFLAELARDVGKSLIIVHHLRKKVGFESGEITLDRVRDSSAIVQLARVVWALDSPDVENDDNKVLYQIKNNLAPYPATLGIEINDTGVKFSDAPIQTKSAKPKSRRERTRRGVDINH